MNIIIDPILNWGYDESVLEPIYFKPGGIGVDVGANVGNHAVAMARSMSHVFALEPDPQNYFQMVAKLAEHSVPNVTPMCIAAGAESKTVTFVAAGGQSRREGTHSQFNPNESTTFSVVQQKLDNILLNLTRVDVIKIDVEGMEAEVLDGGREAIALFGPDVILENHEPIEPGYGAQLQQSEKIMSDLGYRGFAIRPHLILFRRPTVRP